MFICFLKLETMTRIQFCVLFVLTCDLYTHFRCLLRNWNMYRWFIKRTAIKHFNLNLFLFPLSCETTFNFRDAHNLSKRRVYLVEPKIACVEQLINWWSFNILFKHFMISVIWMSLYVVPVSDAIEIRVTNLMTFSFDRPFYKNKSVLNYRPI